MSKKRGLSLEDKRNQLLQIFHESQDFYLLRELEKLGPRKGVISQSVKDVLQSLVDDDLLFKDKIGTSVYFWSLPSSAGNQLRQVRAKLEGDLGNVRQQQAKLNEQLKSCKKGREDTAERETALLELKDLEEKNKILKAELDMYVDNDPATFESMKEACKVAHTAINRWTDNIFALQRWCSSNFPDAKDKLEAVYKEVGITEELDYLE
ncbi:hypothetical protein GOP47_0007148 [Adiantum capillus-veneris]|uniref:Meiotic nuclear division protein 1 homolog n=1 Tax=Adiantum capillus-veneris TaxID=13818 RepID=A0A9D4V0D0_ADICA|nr:hypothetical protein GOP47_0007148 [Adiantum capillus-veneris]